LISVVSHHLVILLIFVIRYTQQHNTIRYEIKIEAVIMGAKSGIQKEVLALYRTLLREASKKDRLAAATTATSSSPATQIEASFYSLLLDESDSSSTNHVRYEFRRQASKVSRKDFRGIEHKIRHGYKQIKLLQMPGVVNFRSW